MKFANPVIVLLALMISGNVFAQEANVGMALDSSSLEDSAVAIYAEACEPLKKDEPKSSVRMRATDKASFNAVANMSELDLFKKKLDRHDLNVLIYGIVDNYVEDMAVRTTSRDGNDICLEVTGYVKKDNINKAFKEMKTAPKEEEEEDARGLNDDDMIEDQKEGVKSQPVISAQSSAITENVEEKIIEAEAPANVPEKKIQLLYLAPVEFFNNTQSESHTKILKEIFANNENFYLTDKEELADYVIKSRVLRAKVDPINKNTNRLQMVLAVGVQFKDTNTTSIEHQNRFILFSSDEDEQKVAADLMKKLFGKAAEPILNKVEQDARKKGSNRAFPQIITPNKA